MNKTIAFLSGKKTYILAVLVGITAVAQTLGYIDSTIASLIYAVLGGSSVATVRSAISKLDAKLPA